jgi:hypothetical protein
MRSVCSMISGLLCFPDKERKSIYDLWPKWHPNDCRKFCLCHLLSSRKFCPITSFFVFKGSVPAKLRNWKEKKMAWLLRTAKEIPPTLYSYNGSHAYKCKYCTYTYFIAGGDTFNNSVFNDSTFNIILIYTQFILHMTTYHTTFKVIYLIWQNCILVIHSDCCPDDGLIGRNM